MEENKIKSLYSDGLDVSFNMYNFTVIVNLFEDSLINLGNIKMSPQTAKAFHKVLGDNLKTYEETFGPINYYTEEVKQKEKELQERLQSLMQEKELGKEVAKDQSLKEVAEKDI